MNAAHWLDTQFGLVLDLEHRLADERAALLNRDTETLRRLAEDKSRLLRALARTADDLPQQLGFEWRSDSIEHWLTEEATPALRSTWSQFIAALERCRHANEANGALLAGRFAQIDTSLRYLREAVGSVVYGASGTQQSGGAPQSIARA